VIFSSKHKFIFIKGRKVAGTSIEMALSPHCGPQDIVTPISPVDELQRLSLGGRPQNYSGKDEVEAHYLALVQAKNIDAAIKTRVHSDSAFPFFNHMPLAAVEALLNPPSEDYTLVYCVRNPYRKVASLANMYISFRQYSGAPMEHSIKEIRASLDKLFASGQYLLARNHELYQSNRPYKARISLRQEQLAVDFTSLLKHLHINATPAQMPRAKQGSRGMGYPINKLFTRAQLNHINTAFKTEFQAHDYPMI